MHEGIFETTKYPETRLLAKLDEFGIQIDVHIVIDFAIRLAFSIGKLITT